MEEAWKLSIFVRAGGGRGGCLVEGVEFCLGRGQVGTWEGGEGEDNIWKSARSTLKVRKNTIFFIEINISNCEICV